VQKVLLWIIYVGYEVGYKADGCAEEMIMAFMLVSKLDELQKKLA
jgi:hypothetical protein